MFHHRTLISFSLQLKKHMQVCSTSLIFHDACSEENNRIESLPGMSPNVGDTCRWILVHTFMSILNLFIVLSSCE